MAELVNEAESNITFIANDNLQVLFAGGLYVVSFEAAKIKYVS